MAGTPDNTAKIEVEADFSLSEEHRRKFEQDLARTTAIARVPDAEPEPGPVRPAGLAPTEARPIVVASDLDPSVIDRMEALLKSIDDELAEVEKSIDNIEDRRDKEERDAEKAAAEGDAGGGSRVDFIGSLGRQIVGLVAGFVALRTILNGLTKAFDIVTRSAGQLNDQFATEVDRLAEFDPAVAAEQARLEFARLEQGIRALAELRRRGVDPARELREERQALLRPSGIEQRVQQIITGFERQRAESAARDIMVDTMNDLNRSINELRTSIADMIETVRSRRSGGDPVGSGALNTAIQGARDLVSDNLLVQLVGSVKIWVGAFQALLESSSLILGGTRSPPETRPTPEPPLETERPRPRDARQIQPAGRVRQDQAGSDAVPAGPNEPPADLQSAVQSGVLQALQRHFGPRRGPTGGTEDAFARNMLPSSVDEMFREAQRRMGIA